jgi:hypothetical protein
VDASSLQSTIGAVDAAIESLSQVIKTQATIEADEKAIGIVLDHLIALRARLRAEEDYIAFRIADDEGGRPLTVVAHLEPGERSAFPWARWYHEQAPHGELRKVPGTYMSLGLSEPIARTMIDSIKAGRVLPSDFVSQLQIVN